MIFFSKKSLICLLFPKIIITFAIVNSLKYRYGINTVLYIYNKLFSKSIFAYETTIRHPISLHFSAGSIGSHQ